MVVFPQLNRLVKGQDVPRHVIYEATPWHYPDSTLDIAHGIATVRGKMVEYWYDNKNQKVLEVKKGKPSPRLSTMKSTVKRFESESKSGKKDKKVKK